MRIALITPGSGDHFYCENCRRDLDMVQALAKQGHDAVLVPLYLPIGEAQASGAPPVFYGAVNVYLEQFLPGYRRLPRSWRRWLDALPVLRWAASRAGSTRAGGLETLTLSMLRGENGRQADELARLVDWLRRDFRPEVVHLSNALLLGLADRIRQQVKVPVVCSLQDEDTWIDAMPAPWSARIWSIMAERAADVKLFLPVSRTYGEALSGRLRLTPERWRVLYPGVDGDTRQAATAPTAPTLGYYARLSPLLGLDLLVDAFLALRQRPGLETLRLHAAGGMTADDRPFVAGLRRRLQVAGATDAVQITESFDAATPAAFLESVSVLSVPVPVGEAFGLFTLEALARGVPAVLPQAGAFPEVAGLTGGVLLYPPGEPGALSAALARVLLEPGLRATLAREGRAGVRQHFDLQRCTVPALLQAYQSVGGQTGAIRDSVNHREHREHRE
jgi:glycosyltransferase involved in cell wall biosynthesis